ncbi:MAG: TRAP transporter small permease [Alphaproteobacteria bacterium]|nr:TRAP transporter small permease [Alphaproteobacteria bacterium]
MDRVMRAFELTAAAFLAAVAAITFVSVFLRYLFARSIPDAYDVCSLLLGILIFWGIAATSYRGEHITVDLVWSVAPPRIKRALDLFAGVLTLICLATLAWMVGTKVTSTLNDNVRTFDLRMPVWIFYFVAWIGLAATVILVGLRLVRTQMQPSADSR